MRRSDCLLLSLTTIQDQCWVHCMTQPNAALCSKSFEARLGTYIFVAEHLCVACCLREYRQC